MHGYGWDGGSIWLMGLWMVIFWGLILTLGIGLVRILFGTSQTQTPPTHIYQENGTSALDIAQKRYARGEISRDEFYHLMNDLKDKQS